MLYSFFHIIFVYFYTIITITNNRRLPVRSRDVVRLRGLIKIVFGALYILKIKNIFICTYYFTTYTRITHEIIILIY